jgi:hypothetical protein
VTTTADIHVRREEPVVFYRAEDLPTTPTGKVEKFRLVQQLSDP